ncbi:MAG: hypothetical protein BJ554DRAFT_5046 [Olpidium bornovanus]|uniref:Uncharacterized protein n=1 Tax=Olpidium bornovanus TaxID=278681 RepID=A0A8H8DDU6_9FUNG|nr:MAG: hypothetical protein BJ554DRAFT_5046 [Olpidium bornovanus]
MLETAPAAPCGPRENSPAKGTGTTETEAGAAELGGGGGSEGRGVGGAQRSWDWSNDAWGTEVGETAEDGGDVAHGNCGSAKPTGTPCHSRITPLEGEHLIDEAAQATTCGADDYGERGGPTDSDVVLAASSSTPRPAERELITAKSPSEEGTADAAGGDKSEPAAEAAGDRAEREEKMCRICFGYALSPGERRLSTTGPSALGDALYPPARCLGNFI